VGTKSSIKGKTGSNSKYQKINYKYPSLSLMSSDFGKQKGA